MPTRSRWSSALRTIAIAVFSWLVGVFTPAISDYLGIAQPDIRYTSKQLPEADAFRALGDVIDPAGAHVGLVSVRLRVKNVGFRQGYINGVEFVPSTMEPMPKIEVLGFNRPALGWHEEQTIEIQALVRVACRQPGPPFIQRPPIEVEVRLFDNTGQQVGRYLDGSRARIKFNSGAAFRWLPTRC